MVLERRSLQRTTSCCSFFAAFFAGLVSFLAFAPGTLAEGMSSSLDDSKGFASYAAYGSQQPRSPTAFLAGAAAGVDFLAGAAGTPAATSLGSL